MKLYCLLLLCLSSCLNIQAQTYTYKPIGFDTSCYWLSGYRFAADNWICEGERLSMVTGDTIIGGYNYSKISTFATGFSYANAYHQMCFGYLNETSPVYLREDTLAKKVFDHMGAVVMDYNLAIGDTMRIASSSTQPIIVDSIRILNINGIDRKLQWGSNRMGPTYTHISIEGIGANYNFPVSMYGEWDIPTYTLRCFSKGGQTLYAANGISSCIKKPKLTVGVTQEPMLDRQAVIVSGRQLTVLDPQILPVRAQIYDILGRSLTTYTINTPKVSLPDLIPGSYVLRLYKEMEAIVIRLQVD